MTPTRKILYVNTTCSLLNDGRSLGTSCGCLGGRLNLLLFGNGLLLLLFCDGLGFFLLGLRGRFILLLLRDGLFGSGGGGGLLSSFYGLGSGGGSLFSGSFLGRASIL